MKFLWNSDSNRVGESESQLLAGHAIGQEATTAAISAAAAKLITGLPAEWPKRKCLNLMT